MHRTLPRTTASGRERRRLVAAAGSRLLARVE